MPEEALGLNSRCILVCANVALTPGKKLTFTYNQAWERGARQERIVHVAV